MQHRVFIIVQRRLFDQYCAAMQRGSCQESKTCTCLQTVQYIASWESLILVARDSIALIVILAALACLFTGRTPELGACWSSRIEIATRMYCCIQSFLTPEIQLCPGATA